MNAFLVAELAPEPPLVAAVLIAGVAYARALGLPRTSTTPNIPIERAGVAAFYTGLFVLLLALASGLGQIGNTFFSARMIQHALLLLLAAPLLAFGTFAQVHSFLLPQFVCGTSNLLRAARLLQSLFQILTRPLSVFVFYSLALWAWHIPLLQRAATQNELVRVLENATLLLAALFFWWAFFRVSSMNGKSRAHGEMLVPLSLNALSSVALGIVLSTNSEPWYVTSVIGTYSQTQAAVSDQQLGGLVLWISSAAIYMIAAMRLMYVWLDSVEQDLRERERTARLEYRPPPFVCERYESAASPLSMESPRHSTLDNESRC